MGLQSAKTTKPNFQLKNQSVDGYYLGNGVSIQGDAFPILVDQFHPSSEPLKVKVSFDSLGVGTVEVANEVDEPTAQQTVDVVLFDIFRDGGTRYYQDREGVGYWKYFEDGRIYDEYPYPHGKDGGLKARELSISLNVVDSF